MNDSIADRMRCDGFEGGVNRLQKLLAESRAFALVPQKGFVDVGGRSRTR
jgi:hypothetical protein